MNTSSKLYDTTIVGPRVYGRSRFDLKRSDKKARRNTDTVEQVEENVGRYETVGVKLVV
jgi:hypothetical protein